MSALRSDLRNFMCLTYNTLTVRVECDDPTHLLWLQEFLIPSFTLVEEVEADCTVVLVVNDQHYAQTLRCGPHPDGHGVECFVLDQGIVQLPVWASASTEHVIFDERFKVFYFVNQENSQICILTAAQNLAARFALLRVVREFAMNFSHTGNNLVIHGAALMVGNSGIVIAGPKGAGKTSLLIYALQNAAACFVSNDRVVVNLAGSEPVLRGMPTLVTIRDRALDLFPELQRPLLEDGSDYRLTLGEAKPRSAPAGQRARGRSFDLSPAQFCALLNRGMRGHSPVRVLLFPHVREESEGIHIQEVSAQAAGQRLTAALFGVNLSPPRTSQVFTLASSPPALDQARLESLCLTLTTQVRCFDWQLGRRAYQDGTVVTDFIQQQMLL
ncbi:MAG: hypothetical protein HY268_28435 [Deltaproteobacteria bacterium]|nr:hypothetical protein [Deltaproteobacteria bacterium]